MIQRKKEIVHIVLQNNESKELLDVKAGDR